MKKLILLFSLLVIAGAYALNVNVDGGEINDIGNITLSPFSIVKGTIHFKVGNITWYPTEIWIIPMNTTPDSFKSTGNTNELSGNVTELGKCTTNIYSNTSFGTAYKITSSNIRNGYFCSTIAPGIYEVVAK